MEYILALIEVEEELGCVSPRYITTDEENHSPVSEKKLDNRKALDVNGRLGEEPSSEIRAVVRIVRVVFYNYRTYSLNRSPP